MEKKQDDARNTETEKKPEAAGRQAQPGSVTSDKVTDVELANEKPRAEKTAAPADTTGTTAAGKPVSGTAGGSVPPVNTEKNDSNAGKGTKGPLIAAVVVVAAIAAGGYYYAQNNNQSESESSSQTSSEPATSTPAEEPAADAAKPDQAPAADTASSASDTSEKAEPAQNDDSSAATPGAADTRTDAADQSTSTADGASTSSDEAGGSNSNTPAEPTAATSQSAQAEPESTASTTEQSDAAAANENSAADASADQSDAGSSESATVATETAPAAAADTANASGAGASGAAASAEGGFTGALPADIRDQLDRQSAQIIALRDQLESSQKQLQQLQTTRLQASRDETTLFVVNDVSRLVTMAQNELAIAGNLENAVTSLETAIKAIDQADAPVLAGLRGALSADIVTLKSAPAISVDAQFAQVSALSAKVASLPMLTPDQAGAKPMAGQSASDTSTAGEVNDTNAGSASGGDAWYERAWNEVKTWPVAAWNGLRSDLGGIVRVEKLADPNQVLLSIDQAAQLRANLQQYLHFAQQALLNGQQGIWTSSLETVVKGVRQSFNQDSVETQQVLAQLQQLLKTGVRPQLPPITQSVKAVEETRRQLKPTNPGQE